MAALDEQWGARLREHRTDRGLTLMQLAVAADSNPGNLSRIERGLERAGDELRIRLANALGVRVEDIWAYPSEVAS